MYDRRIKVWDEPHTPEELERAAKAGVKKGKLLGDAHGDSFLRQMRTIRRLKVGSVLEIGPGEGTVRDYMRALGLVWDTVDISIESTPTFRSRLEELDADALAGRWELVCAFQMLEHSPYEAFVPNLRKMAVMSRRWVYLSLPYSCRGFRLELSWLSGQNWRGGRALERYWPTNLPNRRYRPEYLAEFPWVAHQWEIGRQGFPLARILADVGRAGLRIVEREHGRNPFHYFILAEKT
jgi:hypothetical protein